MSVWDEMVLVGRITRPHGLHGHVVVHPETDFPERRFAAGASLWLQDGPASVQVTVRAMRLQNRRVVVAFDGIDHIADAEPLCGRELRVPEAALEPLGDGAYYEHQLVGCAVTTVAGEPVGTVRRIEGGVGSSRLVVDATQGEVLVPLAAGICVGIDVGAREIRIDPPEGLLELNVTQRSRAVSR